MGVLETEYLDNIHRQIDSGATSIGYLSDLPLDGDLVGHDGKLYDNLLDTLTTLNEGLINAGSEPQVGQDLFGIGKKSSEPKPATKEDKQRATKTAGFISKLIAGAKALIRKAITWFKSVGPKFSAMMMKYFSNLGKLEETFADNISDKVEINKDNSELYKKLNSILGGYARYMTNDDPIKAIQELTDSVSGKSYVFDGSSHLQMIAKVESPDKIFKAFDNYNKEAEHIIAMLKPDDVNGKTFEGNVKNAIAGKYKGILLQDTAGLTYKAFKLSGNEVTTKTYKVPVKAKEDGLKEITVSGSALTALLKKAVAAYKDYKPEAIIKDITASYKIQEEILKEANNLTNKKTISMLIKLSNLFMSMMLDDLKSIIRRFKALYETFDILEKKG